MLGVGVGVGVGVYSCLPSLSLIDSFIFPDH